MKFVNDFGINPSRGTGKSAGIDFYMPDPFRWTDKQFEKFFEYLESTEYSRLTKFIDDSARAESCAAILLYLCWDPCVTEPFLEHSEELKKGILTVAPGDSVCVPTGIRTLFGEDYCGIFFNKSGRGKEGFVVKAQVIDPDYTGYVHVNLVNTSKKPLKIKLGMKLSQIIEIPVVWDEPEEISSEDYFLKMSDSERGDGAFGHTDNK